MGDRVHIALQINRSRSTIEITGRGIGFGGSHRSTGRRRTVDTSAVTIEVAIGTIGGCGEDTIIAAIGITAALRMH